MGYLEELPELERDAFQHFVEGPGLRVMVTFLNRSLEKSAARLLDPTIGLDEIRLNQGKCEGYRVINAFLKEAVKVFAAPAENREDNNE